MVSTKYFSLALVSLVVAAPNEKREEVAKPGVVRSAFSDYSFF